MKKFSFSIILLLCLIIISACSGYKPIFGTSNLKLTKHKKYIYFY